MDTSSKPAPELSRAWACVIVPFQKITIWLDFRKGVPEMIRYRRSPDDMRVDAAPNRRRS